MKTHVGKTCAKQSTRLWNFGRPPDRTILYTGNVLTVRVRVDRETGLNQPAICACALLARILWRFGACRVRLLGRKPGKRG